MGLILTRSPFHISRGTLDANASALVEVGRIECWYCRGFRGICFKL